MFDRLARRYRSWRYRRILRRGGELTTDQILRMMSDWMFDVAEGFHRHGDHDRENDVIAVGRQWSEEGLAAYEAGDADQLRAVCFAANEAVLGILRKSMAEAGFDLDRQS